METWINDEVYPIASEQKEKGTWGELHVRRPLQDKVRRKDIVPLRKWKENRGGGESRNAERFVSLVRARGHAGRNDKGESPMA